MGLLLFCFSLPTYSQNLITNEQINTLSLKHGEMAKRRLFAWKKLIDKNQKISEREKLEKVNTFFNYFSFKSDIKFTGHSDYWMTPTEFVINGAGDCEDFSIAKYFTLLAIGIPVEKLRIMYVKALSLNQAHMVLLYYPSPSDEPLVLDNLISKIKPAIDRKDLVPVYSFNGEGLWLNKLKNQGSRIGTSKKLSKWQSMLQRMKLMRKIK